MKKEEKKEQHIDEIDMEIDIEGATAATLKKVKAELKQCQKERQEYLTGWQRARADSVNERNEMKKQAEFIAGTVQEKIFLDILPVLDSFSMAFRDKKKWESIDANWRKGIEHIYSNFVSLLAQYDFIPFSPSAGEGFNPNEHESLETIPTNNKKEDLKIIEVLQEGYRRGHEILRPAKVRVAIYQKPSNV